MPMQATTTAPLFSAALKPDRSPRVTGGWVALSIAAVIAAPFALLVPNVWLPITAAFAIAIASLVVYTVREARQQRLTQRVTLWADQLEIATIDETGARTLTRFNPKTVRLVLQRDKDEKTLAVHLAAGQSTQELGAFLSNEDRSSFAKAFGTALRRARAMR